MVPKCVRLMFARRDAGLTRIHKVRGMDDRGDARRARIAALRATIVAAEAEADALGLELVACLMAMARVEMEAG